MKKLLASLMAVTVLSMGTAAMAGPLSDMLNNAAKSVEQTEADMNQAHKDAQARQKARQQEYDKKKQNWEKQKEQAKKDAEARQKARQDALEKKQQEWAKQKEQARKDAEARQKARQETLQKKKDAWNTLIGK